MASRLAETVDGIVAELTHGAVTLPPFLTGMLQKMLRTTPPADDDIYRTFDTIRSHLRYVETGVRVAPDAVRSEVAAAACTTCNGTTEKHRCVALEGVGVFMCPEAGASGE